MHISFRRMIKMIPTLLLAFVLAVIVWVSAVTASDPNEIHTLSQPVAVEIIGQDPSLVITQSIPTQVKVSLNAPRSVWTRLNLTPTQVKAYLDLSGLQSGTYKQEIQLQVGIQPANVISYTPHSVSFSLEKVATHSFPIQLVLSGEPAIGFEAGTPVLSATEAIVSGPESQIGLIKTIQTVIDLTEVHTSIKNTYILSALDANKQPVTGVSLLPENVDVSLPITQRGGYRNVAVKVVTQGRVANGYRLTNISVAPPSVTIYSSDPAKVNDLPGYIETVPINIEGAKSDIDSVEELNLPADVAIVGIKNVTVQVGVAPIESSLTLSHLNIMVNSLDPRYQALISPTTVDVILSGPLPLLDNLTAADVQVEIDLQGLGAGSHQITPNVRLSSNEIRVESVLPVTLEVTITPASGPTPTVKP